jgi:hypothetical protein
MTEQGPLSGVVRNNAIVLISTHRARYHAAILLRLIDPSGIADQALSDDIGRKGKRQ